MKNLKGTPAVAKFFGRGVWDIDRLIYSHGLRLASEPQPPPAPRVFPLIDLYTFALALELIDLTKEKAGAVTATNHFLWDMHIEVEDMVREHHGNALQTDDEKRAAKAALVSSYLADPKNADDAFTHRDLLHPIFFIARLDDWERGTYRITSMPDDQLFTTGIFGATGLWLVNATKLFREVDLQLAMMEDKP